MLFAVCGLHMRNGKLNDQLISRGATFVKEAKTHSNYSMHALFNDTPIAKPALVYHPEGRADGLKTSCINIEIWDVPQQAIGSVLQLIPSPLSLGNVILEDSTTVYGFISEGWATDHSAAKAMGLRTEDITEFGGWREWQAHLSASA